MTTSTAYEQVVYQEFKLSVRSEDEQLETSCFVNFVRTAIRMVRSASTKQSVIVCRVQYTKYKWYIEYSSTFMSRHGIPCLQKALSLCTIRCVSAPFAASIDEEKQR